LGGGTGLHSEGKRCRSRRVVGLPEKKGANIIVLKDSQKGGGGKTNKTGGCGKKKTLTNNSPRTRPENGVGGPNMLFLLEDRAIRQRTKPKSTRKRSIGCGAGGGKEQKTNKKKKKGIQLHEKDFRILARRRNY